MIDRATPNTRLILHMKIQGHGELGPTSNDEAAQEIEEEIYSLCDVCDGRVPRKTTMQRLCLVASAMTIVASSLWAAWCDRPFCDRMLR